MPARTPATSAPASPPASGRPGSQYRARRPRDGRWIAGVCAGLADNWGWPVVVVRMAFLVVAVANGIGVIAYVALWVVMPSARNDGESGQRDLGRMLGFGALTLGVVVLGTTFGWATFQSWIAPVLLLALGAAILWQQRGFALSRIWWSWVPAGVGVLLIVGGVLALLVGEVGWWQALRFGAIALAILGGVALLASPWLVALYSDLVGKRSALIREQERTEIATQVHDSVLQTLTLIQQNVTDAQTVQRLARGEERRLRSWLYTPTGAPEESLLAGLRHTVAEVEQQYGADIEVVGVGDAQWSPRVEAVVAAAREAMVNAAKHAGRGAAISVYSEVSAGGVAVFIRDRGNGFDPTDLPHDRQGVRESILGRMSRIGGEAQVRSSSKGTEVELNATLEES